MVLGGGGEPTSFKKKNSVAAHRRLILTCVDTCHTSRCVCFTSASASMTAAGRPAGQRCHGAVNWNMDEVCGAKHSTWCVCSCAPQQGPQ